jgi:ribosomal-protein-alanine N-acetyltransferase
MTPEALAALHALAFTERPRPWSVAEFAALLRQPATLLATEPGGFALGRTASGEAELLTLAVDPAARRRGLGTRLIRAYEAQAKAAGAVESLLEVALTNVAARALYERLGYVEAGRRRGYYTLPGVPAVDALVLRRRLEICPNRTESCGG